MRVCSRMLSFWRACARTKTGNSKPRGDLAHARVFTVFEAVNVAIFDFLPTAVFLLAPHVTSFVTGPSAILSVVIGAAAAILSGFSFLDLRSRVWRSPTSTQDAIYRTGSEVSSFAVAWSSVAKTVALTSALVRGCSQSLNYLMGQRLTVLSLSLFGWVPAPTTIVVDILGFMMCMVVWAVVALRLVLRPPRTVLVGFSLAVLVVLGVLAGVAVTALDGENWIGAEKFFQEGYEGVMSGASIFYLSLTVFDNLSRSVEYSSPKSCSLHLRSSLLGVAILGLLLAGSSSMISSLAPGSNYTTEQPLSESFEASGSGAWTKYLVCVASMVFLAPSIFVQFDRSVETMEDMARDGLIGRVLISDDDSQERSVLMCLGLGCLCALGCAALSIVTLCELAAVGLLVEHLVVVATVLTIRFQATDSGADAEEVSVGVTRDARRGDDVISQLSFYAWLRETVKLPEEIGEEKDNEDEEREERKADDSGDNQLPENFREEFGKGVTGEEGPENVADMERFNSIKLSSYSLHNISFQNISDAAGDSSASNESVSSSTETLEIQSTTTEPFISHMSDATNSPDSDDSADETDIDAIVEEYLNSQKPHEGHRNPISPSNSPQPTQTTYRKARLSILLYVISCLALGAILAHAQNRVQTGHPVWIVSMVMSMVGLLASLVWLRHQPEVQGEEQESRLGVRNLSLVYAAAILLICAMLLTQQEVTSAAFGAWSALGLAVYVIRGVRRDGQNRPPGGQLPDEETSLLQPTTSSSVYREDKPPRDHKSFIFGDDIFNGSSPLP